MLLPRCFERLTGASIRALPGPLRRASANPWLSPPIAPLLFVMGEHRGRHSARSRPGRFPTVPSEDRHTLGCAGGSASNCLAALQTRSSSRAIEPGQVLRTLAWVRKAAVKGICRALGRGRRGMRVRSQNKSARGVGSCGLRCAAPMCVGSDRTIHPWENR